MSPSDEPLAPDVSVYLHIPFCRFRCDYCDFFTRTRVAPYRVDLILSAMRRQLSLYLEQLQPGTVPTVYMGGGTPSSIGMGKIGPLVEDVLGIIGTVIAKGSGTHTLDPPAEVTVEVNPEDVTEGLLDELTTAGVTRLSVGVQSLNEGALTAMGRHVTLQATVTGLETIARRWNSSWSADLIIAVPGDSVSRVKRDLDRLLEYGADHVSVYELTVERSTRLSKLIDQAARSLPAPDTREYLFEVARSQLLEAGFHHYEISNFARPGGQSRHNLVYWRMQPHIGVGPGAVGTVPETNAPAGRRTHAASGAASRAAGPSRGWAVRLENARSFGPYVTAPDFGVSMEPLSAADLFFEYLMMGFRTSAGVSRTDVRAVFGVDPLDLVPSAADRWSRHLDTTGSHVWLDWPGRKLLNRFLVDCRAELDDTAARLTGYRWPAREN